MKLDLNGKLDFRTCSFRYFYPGEKHVDRVCEESVLLLVMDGALVFGEDGEEKEIRAGEYYIQRAFLTQRGTRPSLEPKYFYVHFSGKFGAEGLPLRGKWDQETLMPLLKSLDSARVSGENQMRKNLIFYSVLSELCKAEKNEEESFAASVKRALTQKYKEKITIEEIAASLYASVNYVIRAFKNEYGVTPHKFLTGLRLAEAEQLLRDTNRSEESIAFEVGYSDFSAFYKAFRARRGGSPSAYRKAHSRFSDA